MQRRNSDPTIEFRLSGETALAAARWTFIRVPIVLLLVLVATDAFSSRPFWSETRLFLFVLGVCTLAAAAVAFLTASCFWIRRMLWSIAVDGQGLEVREAPWRRIALPWSDIAAASDRPFGWPRTLVIKRKSDAFDVELPLDVEDPAGFRSAVLRNAPLDNPLISRFRLNGT
jgi:hypothetical protein